MKLPRDLSAQDLIIALASLGYKVTRQTGSHIRLTTYKNGEHHITIPAHNPLKIGTLNSLLRDIGNHTGLSRQELVNRLFQ